MTESRLATRDYLHGITRLPSPKSWGRRRPTSSRGSTSRKRNPHPILLMFLLKWIWPNRDRMELRGSLANPDLRDWDEVGRMNRGPGGSSRGRSRRTGNHHGDVWLRHRNGVGRRPAGRHPDWRRRLACRRCGAATPSSVRAGWRERCAPPMIRV